MQDSTCFLCFSVKLNGIYWLFLILIKIAVSSQEQKNCKPGRCPSHEGGRYCPEQFDITDECLDDFQCSGDKKCCSDGCELKCLSPATGL